MKITETCLYVDNIEKAERFYSVVMNFHLVKKDKNRHLFYKFENGMLLIFNPATTQNEKSEVNGSPIPVHGATGTSHIAFSVNTLQYFNWKEQLKKHSIKIESEIEWPGGTKSFYFRDPSGNSLEIIHGDMWNLEDFFKADTS